MTDTDDASMGGMERVNLPSNTLDLLDQYRSDDGGRESYDGVIQEILRDDSSPSDRLESHLERVNREWKQAVEDGDEKGAAYALGKKSAFITAIEAATGWPVDTDA